VADQTSEPGAAAGMPAESVVAIRAAALATAVVLPRTPAAAMPVGAVVATPVLVAATLAGADGAMTAISPERMPAAVGAVAAATAALLTVTPMTIRVRRAEAVDEAAEPGTGPSLTA
jgi:hypothetical protein